jgi:hypothetical protein
MEALNILLKVAFQKQSSTLCGWDLCREARALPDSAEVKVAVHFQEGTLMAPE